MSDLETWEMLFQALFFGKGSWLGLLIILGLIIILMAVWKYAGALCIPVAIFVGIEYLNNNLGWHGLIMFFATIFISFFLIKNVKKY